MMSQQDRQVTCTGDVWCGCTCTDCTVTFDHCRPNQHPVDSTYHPCCNTIGLHGCDCAGPAEANVRQTDIALLLDGSANLIELTRHDLNEALRRLPNDAPLFAVADLVTALGHLRAASVLTDRCAEQLQRDQAVKA